MLQKKNDLLVTAHVYRVPFFVRKDMRRQDVGSCIQNWLSLGSSSVRRTCSANHFQRIREVNYSYHASSSRKQCKPKDSKQRYIRFVNSNVVHNGKQHADLNNMLRNMFPCTFCLSSNHCVDKCDKRKSIIKKMFMSNGIETERRKYYPRLKACEPRGAQKNFCTHYNISGHWVEKC